MTRAPRPGMSPVELVGSRIPCAAGTARAQAATVMDGLGMKAFVVVDFEGVDFAGEVFAHAIFVDHMYRYTYRPGAINARPEVAVVIRRMERLAELRRYSDAQS